MLRPPAALADSSSAYTGRVETNGIGLASQIRSMSLLLATHFARLSKTHPLAWPMKIWITGDRRPLSVLTWPWRCLVKSLTSSSPRQGDREHTGLRRSGTRCRKPVPGNPKA